MSQTNGRLTTCDICGATVFSACIGEGETDGGFTRWNKFEPLPEGWMHEWDIGLGYLCPTCSAKFLQKKEQLEREMREMVQDMREEAER